MLIPGTCNLSLYRGASAVLYCQIRASGDSPLDLTAWSVRAVVSPPPGHGQKLPCECSTISASGTVKISIPGINAKWGFIEAILESPEGGIFDFFRGEIELKESLFPPSISMREIKATVPENMAGNIIIDGGYRIETEIASLRAKESAQAAMKISEDVKTTASNVEKALDGTEKARVEAEGYSEAAKASAQRAGASELNASTILKSCIKTGQLETATLGGGLLANGEIISQSPPKTMNSMLRIGESFAESIMVKDLNTILDVNRLKLVGTGARNDYKGVDFGNLNDFNLRGVNLYCLYWEQEWKSSACLIDLVQWFGFNFYLCATYANIYGSIPYITPVNEYSRLVDNAAQFSFVSQVSAKNYDLECLNADGSSTRTSSIIRYSYHGDFCRLLLVGRGDSDVDLYVVGGNGPALSTPGMSFPKKLGTAKMTRVNGDQKPCVFLGFLRGGEFNGNGHSMRGNAPQLSRVKWLLGNDLSTKIQQLSQS